MPIRDRVRWVGVQNTEPFEPLRVIEDHPPSLCIIEGRYAAPFTAPIDTGYVDLSNYSYIRGAIRGNVPLTLQIINSPDKTYVLDQRTYNLAAGEYSEINLLVLVHYYKFIINTPDAAATGEAVISIYAKPC